MKCDKYMGMDVHQATTVVDVLDADGKPVLATIVATEAAAIIRLLQGVSRSLHVTFEETTQAAWLYEVVRGSRVRICRVDRPGFGGRHKPNSIPPRTTWKSSSPRGSDRTMVGNKTAHPLFSF